MKKFIILILVFNFSLIVFGQEKQDNDINSTYPTYEYANIILDGRTMKISYSSDEYEEIEFEKGEITYFNYTPVLKKLETLSSEGWEVIDYVVNVNISPGVPKHYLLKRKKVEK